VMLLDLMRIGCRIAYTTYKEMVNDILS